MYPASSAAAASPAEIEMLLEMGFNQNAATAALVQCGGSVDTALEWLLATGDAYNGGVVRYKTTSQNAANVIEAMIEAVAITVAVTEENNSAEVLEELPPMQIEEAMLAMLAMLAEFKAAVVKVGGAENKQKVEANRLAMTLNEIGAPPRSKPTAITTTRVPGVGSGGGIPVLWDFLSAPSVLERVPPVHSSAATTPFADLYKSLESAPERSSARPLSQISAKGKGTGGHQASSASPILPAAAPAAPKSKEQKSGIVKVRKGKVAIASNANADSAAAVANMPTPVHQNRAVPTHAQCDGTAVLIVDPGVPLWEYLSDQYDVARTGSSEVGGVSVCGGSSRSGRPHRKKAAVLAAQAHRRDGKEARVKAALPKKKHHEDKQTKKVKKAKQMQQDQEQQQEEEEEEEEEEDGLQCTGSATIASSATPASVEEGGEGGRRGGQRVKYRGGGRGGGRGRGRGGSSSGGGRGRSGHGRGRDCGVGAFDRGAGRGGGTSSEHASGSDSGMLRASAPVFLSVAAPAFHPKE
eukprot:gene14624-26844_t